MILVITAIIFLLMIASFWVDKCEFGGFLGVCFLVCIVVIICLAVELTRYRTIDNKIKMYIEENTNIENKVKETVRAYMNFEENTYTELIKDADLTTLMIKYPELNSNELVKTEINLYVQNNNKIKELKEKKIEETIVRWWLYFGK